MRERERERREKREERREKEETEHLGGAASTECTARNGSSV